MKLIEGALSIVEADPMSWRADWAWGIPLIMLTVVIHVVGLGLIGQLAVQVSSRIIGRRHPTSVFMVVVGVSTLSITVLHAIEASMWASAYWLLGALSSIKSSVLYSLNAITSYGNSGVLLEERWRLLGALEALNGWLLFGLTTAFLFAMIQKVRALGGKGEHY